MGMRLTWYPFAMGPVHGLSRPLRSVPRWSRILPQAASRVASRNPPDRRPAGHRHPRRTDGPQGPCRPARPRSLRSAPPCQPSISSQSRKSAHLSSSPRARSALMCTAPKGLAARETPVQLKRTGTGCGEAIETDFHEAQSDRLEAIFSPGQRNIHRILLSEENLQTKSISHVSHRQIRSAARPDQRLAKDPPSDP